MARLSHITIDGFRSFGTDEKTRQERTLEFGDVTILLGANGSGKSSFLGAFRMLNFMLTDALQIFVARNLYADSILHYGTKATRFMRMEVGFRNDDRENRYDAEWVAAARGILIFTREKVVYHRAGFPEPRTTDMGVGHAESKLREFAASGDASCRVLSRLLAGCKTYQFHDTSAEADIRQGCPIRDGRYLRENAGNLAGFLCTLKSQHPAHYARICDTIRLAFPLFGEFELEPSPENREIVFLDWREKGRDYLFGPHHVSDGTLRFMALASLFLQPEELMPQVILIDEPELGLHPAALSLLAGMVKSASASRQVVLATQSVSLVNHFAPEDVVVLERPGDSTVMKRVDRAQLQAWIDDFGYGVGDLWDRNLIGGRP